MVNNVLELMKELNIKSEKTDLLIISNKDKVLAKMYEAQYASKDLSEINASDKTEYETCKTAWTRVNEPYKPAFIAKVIEQAVKTIKELKKIKK